MKKDAVIITLVDFKGSVPQILGAKAMVTKAGLIKGTVGGGKVEAKAILFAKDVLQNPDSPVCQLQNWNLTLDVGMTCGGVVTFLFELIRPRAWNIVVFGAGHVAQELVPMLTKLKCHVTCIDPRSDWLSLIPQTDNLEKIIMKDPFKAVKNFSSDSYFILMTQGHGTDLPILTEILKTNFNFPFVGVIGSKTKAMSLKSNLKKLDLNEELINKFYCPIGLDFGDNTPIEISHSIVAQLLKVRDDRSAT